jgi:hypothetical protein
LRLPEPRLSLLSLDVVAADERQIPSRPILDGRAVKLECALEWTINDTGRRSFRRRMEYFFRRDPFRSLLD